jgi:hypothetical protein
MARSLLDALSEELRASSTPMTSSLELAESFPTATGGAGYAMSLGIVTLIVFIALIGLAAVGREARGIEF